MLGKQSLRTYAQICNEDSLSLVRDMWRFYGKASSLVGIQNIKFGKKLDADLTLSIKLRQMRSAGSPASLSAAPIILEKDASFFSFPEHYWKHGTSEHNIQKVKEVKFSNPMFATLNCDFSVLY